MKIAFIGAHGYPTSYASAEDMVRELGPRFVRDGHQFVVHIWATKESRASRTKTDLYNGIRRVFHETPGGKASGQFFVALKASISAAFSDSELVHYQCLNSAVFCWIPRLTGKRVVVNVNGQIWKDPKWPIGLRQLYFGFSALLSLLFGNKVITDSYHMSQYYKRVSGAKLPYIGYGCSPNAPARASSSQSGLEAQNGYYMVMSRVTPHNLTDIIVDGFIQSGSKAKLFVAGHLPDTKFVQELRRRSEGKNVEFLGLVGDQNKLNDLLMNCRAYLHGHSLGGINSALVRVVGLERPVICVDTVFNREVVEDPNGKLQAMLFDKSAESVAGAIRTFEQDQGNYTMQSQELGAAVRQKMSWDVIYDRYRELYNDCVQ
jgi:glycosyltransferase involved in cell wall biosynthesis